MEPGTKTSQFTLSTYYSTSKSNPVFYLKKPVFNITGFKVDSAIIANEFYTFDSRNNKIKFQENSGSAVTITIPTGNYTSSSIATTLKTILEADSPNTRTYTITYTSLTGKLTIAVNTGTVQFLTVDKHAYYELGLINSLSSASASITGEIIDLSGVKTVYLVSSAFGTDVGNLVGSNYNILASIPVNNSFLSILSYQNSNEFVDVNLDNLFSIDFVLLDERTRPLTVTKDYTITLLIKSV